MARSDGPNNRPADFPDDLPPEAWAAIAKAERATPCEDCGRFCDPPDDPSERTLCDGCRPTRVGRPTWSGTVPWMCGCCLGACDAPPPDARFGLCTECLEHCDDTEGQPCLAHAPGGDPPDSSRGEP